MKYCTNCGNLLKNNTNFCTNCGKPTKAFIERENIKRMQMKEDNKEKLFLSIGTLFIIVASLIFSFANWNNMSDIFRILFLIIEALLFLSISVLSQKINEKFPYKLLWFIGISFVPIIFNLIAVDKVLGNYLSYEGAGIYVYLSISSLICCLLYYLSEKLYSSNIFVYVSFLFAYLTIVFTLYSTNILTLEIIFIVLSVFNLIISTLYLHIKNDRYRKCSSIFISLLLPLFSILSCMFVASKYNPIFVGIIVFLNIITLIMYSFKSNKNIITIIYPIFEFLVLDFGIFSLFNGYTNVITFSLILGSILIHFIMTTIDNKSIKLVSYIYMLFNILVILLINSIGYNTLFVTSLILILTFVFIIKFSDEKVQSTISKVLLPIVSYTLILSITKIFIDASLVIALIVTSVSCFTVYVIFNQRNMDTVIKISFETFSYIYLAVSSIMILTSSAAFISFILNEILWVYYYIYNSFVLKNKSGAITLLVALILNFVLCSGKYSVPSYYSLLFLSTIAILLDYVSNKFKVNSNFIYFSLVSTSIAILICFSNVTILGLCIGILAYVVTYYSLVKNHKNNFIIKYLFTLVGFYLINFTYSYFISQIVISSIITLITYIIILISMFLLEVETDNKVFSYSFVLLFPYMSIVNNFAPISEYALSFKLFITIVLIFIYLEKVFKLDEKSIELTEIILLILIHVNSIFDTLIFNFIIGSFYLFYGFYKKRSSLCILGAVLLVFTLLFNIFNIINNIAITYLLLVIGILMLIYVFYIEFKKKKNK